MNSDLGLQFSDSFDNDFESRWVLPSGPSFTHPVDTKFSVKLEGGYAVAEGTTTRPPGPKVKCAGRFVSKDRPIESLAGVNIFEITLVDYIHSGDHLHYMDILGWGIDTEDPVAGHHIMGWGLTMGTRPGPVCADMGDKDRAVQLHFDVWSKLGPLPYVCRSILSEDIEKYPALTTEEGRKYISSTVDVPRKLIYRARKDCLVLGHPSGPTGDSSGHRYGVRLSDDGNTLSWMLDGKIMDSYDVTGYFNSRDVILDNGLYISVGMAGAYRRNVWRFDDARAYVMKE